jgi:TorA maturation chaperone TorD
MQAHLSAWAFDFLRATATRGDAVFYRGAALLCEDTLHTAQDMLASLRA